MDSFPGSRRSTPEITLMSVQPKGKVPAKRVTGRTKMLLVCTILLIGTVLRFTSWSGRQDADEIDNVKQKLYSLIKKVTENVIPGEVEKVGREKPIITMHNECAKEGTPEPNLHRPFVFFHIPKCAGSTLRGAIHEAAMTTGKRILSPCYDGIPCATTEKNLREEGLMKKAGCADVISGHFTTQLLSTLMTLNKNQQSCSRDWLASYNGTKLPPIIGSCVVAIREPISRFISHYYHFLYKNHPKWKGKSMSQLSLENITGIITSNANNTMVGYLSNHGGHWNATPWDEKIERSNEVLSHCTVMIVEDWNASVNLAETAIPWLKGYISGAVSKNVASSKPESVEDFTAEIASAIRSMLHADITLYEMAVQVHQEQLRHYNMKPILPFEK